MSAARAWTEGFPEHFRWDALCTLDALCMPRMRLYGCHLPQVVERARYGKAPRLILGPCWKDFLLSCCGGGAAQPPPRHEICTFYPESAPATKSDFKAPPPSLSPARALMEGFPHNCLWDEICTVSPAPAPAKVSTVWRSRRSGKHRLGNNRVCKHAHSKCTHVHLSRDWQWLG